MNISNVKLVIWDLDETFWKGTLSEGPVFQIKENIKIIKELVDRGIMNSIVSKNDYEKAINVLKEWGVAEYFIFPQISWNPKGEKVKKLLDICKLRASNTVFIDDNMSNLEEVKFYNPNIEVMLPMDLNFELLKDPAFKGKDDVQHSRLRQYRILENRTKIEESFSSNEEFLRSSHIKISICNDCENEIERIYELLQRSNQLNYTKIRLSLDELQVILKSVDYECAYIKVSDNFGNYGIVGFYALKDQHLEHFLFSCRTLGFGIENYLYKKLGFPNITIVGGVTTALDSVVNIDWIEEVEQNESAKYRKIDEESKPNTILKMLMIGGCDLEQASMYLESTYSIKHEFSTVIAGNEIRTSDTSQLVNTLKLNSTTKHELCENIPFFDENITFNTTLFSGEYDIILLSVVDDYIRGTYKHKIDNYFISYGGFYDQDEFIARYDREKLKYLFDNFLFIGKEDKTVFEENLRIILSMLSDKTRVILINGIDLDVSDWLGKERCERNLEMNAVVDRIIEEYKNVWLLDMRKIVKDRSVLIKHDNRHFSRAIYYDMAQEIARICSDEFRINGLKTNSRFFVESAELINHMKNKVKRIVRPGGHK
ncbi:MAG: HAD-IIIC family phosphatase [Lacrimispora sphenoides]